LNGFEDPLSNVLKQKLNVFFWAVNFLLKHKKETDLLPWENGMKRIAEFCFLGNITDNGLSPF